MQTGIYEELITQLVSEKINTLDKNSFSIHTSTLDKSEAADTLSKHLAFTIKNALNFIKGDHQIENQIAIANKIILVLKEELKHEEFENDLIDIEGTILNAVFSKVDAQFSNLDLRLKEITPYTRLTHSELFTGGNVGLSLESELKKEILSSDSIDLLVSFVKFKGIIILEKELREFTQNGGQLRLITTTYMGATDYKAIHLLSQLPNTKIKISYNSGNERLHAKAYLFKRKTGFHTGYIGSSNFSRSALTDGLEWNLKITTKEVSHIIDKFQKTFDTYWQNEEFEIYKEEESKIKLIEALSHSKNKQSPELKISYFDVKPFHFQLEILEQLEVERTEHQRYRNLVVAATGTGKTVISAFDFKRFLSTNPTAKLLFLAHRKEILIQSRSTFSYILKDSDFGELWVDGDVPARYNHVFASVQTLKNQINELNLSKDFFDYIVIDECHHLTANSYRDIINYFTPQILLGLTATPERMDGGDIQEDFHNRIAAEIRLPEAMNKKLLCPFQYFGISDSVDLDKVNWERGRYVASEISALYTANDRRVSEIINALEKYTKDIQTVTCVGFCITVEHAKYMASKFSLAGLKSAYLTSENNNERHTLRNEFIQKKINYLFVVDIFNEGIDIPEIDTVLFLRPTESLTVFLQQLGRGLRLSENKDSLTVLDFVGNCRPEYNFQDKFRALVGKTSTPISKEIEDDFPHLPLGCSIILEKKAKTIILSNIQQAISLNRNQIINKIKTFKHQSSLELNLNNFIRFTNIQLQTLYKKGSWSKLCYEAGLLPNFTEVNDLEITRAVLNKWLACNSISYFKFILSLAEKNFKIMDESFDEIENQMLLMLYYDVWQEASRFNSLEESIVAIGRNKYLVLEIIAIMNILIDKVSHKEIDIELPYQQPLKLHSRYTRDQILAAIGLSTFERKSPSREGVAINEKINTEILFINLIKSEENFSPTTMYDDYAISETLFHWQSQNSAGPETKKGKSYINHQKNNKKILLFVREKHTDEFGQRHGFVFVGEGKLIEYSGAKPMNIKWELCEPLPNYLWKEAAKLRVG
jgi:superfamily II DNA or RNA helicase